MVIRVARLEDTPAMGRVMVDTYLAAHLGQVPEDAWKRRSAEWTEDISAAGWARALREIADGTNPRECLYVAEEPAPSADSSERGQIVGIAMGGPASRETIQKLTVDLGDPEKTAAVYALYVRQSHQRRGLGRRLVRAVVADLLEKGFSSLTIACLETNAPGRRFYEALGGGVIGEQDADEYGFTVREVVYGWKVARKLLPGSAE